MKTMKILAVFLILIGLTTGALAADSYTGFSGYEKFDKNEFELIFPEGVDAQVDKTGNHADVLILSSTEWTTAAAMATEFSYVPLWADSAMPEEAAVAIGVVSFGNKNALEADLEACREQYLPVMLSSSLNGTRYEASMADYSAETNTVIPREYIGNNCLYYLVFYFNEARTECLGAKYATINLTFADNDAQKVSLNRVPDSRYVPDSRSDVDIKTKTAGELSYVMDQSADGTTLNTTVRKPDGALSYRSSGYAGAGTGAAQDLVIPTSVSAGMDVYQSNMVIILWYDGPIVNGEPSGELKLAERLKIEVTAGEPVPWPNYINQNDATKADVKFIVSKDGGNTAASFAEIDHNDTLGTATIKSSGKAADNEDLTQYQVIATLTPPSTDAVKYVYETYEEYQVIGRNNYNYESYANLLDENPNRLSVSSTGKAVIVSDLFKSATYSDDPGLTVYYDTHITDDAAGSVTFIDWYDFENNFVSRQWYVRQFKSMALLTETDVEAEVPNTATAPTLVIAEGANDYNLSVLSYPQSSEDGTQMHYELSLLDPDGAQTEISEVADSALLLIPIPEDVDPASVDFTVNHYSESGKLQESFTADALEVTDAGVLVEVSSLSPFVLSWDHVHNLVYTVSGNTFVETCSDTSCTHRATWSLEVNETVEVGSTIEINPDRSANWLGSGLTIVLTDADGNVYDEVPTVPGAYTLKVSVGNAEMTFPITVIAPPSLPATGDNSLPLALLAAMAFASITAMIVMKKARRA